MRRTFVTLIFLHSLIAFKCQTLPSSIKKCHFGDGKCIVSSMNDVIRRFSSGLSAIGLRPIDVVHMKHADIWNNAEIGGAWLQFKLLNHILYGFENTTIKRVKGFGKDPTASAMEIYGQIPSLKEKGDFISKGRVWMIPVNATGKSTSDLQNFRFILKLKVIPEYRNNKRYLKVYELVPVINITRWILWLDNLFPDNMDLTIAVNELLNSNWLEFWNELEPFILNIFSKVFISMIEDIFQRIPYDDLFLKDNETELNGQD